MINFAMIFIKVLSGEAWERCVTAFILCKVTNYQLISKLFALFFVVNLAENDR